jgi:hypothetical protein
MPCKADMRKFTIFSLVENVCPEEKVYHINVLYAAYGLAENSELRKIPQSNCRYVTNKTARTCARKYLPAIKP